MVHSDTEVGLIRLSARKATTTTLQCVLKT